MRRILAVALMLLLLGGSALAERVPGNWLGFQALAQLSDGTRNTIVSPVGLTWSLAMAAEGAEGDTLQRLLKALDIEAPEDAAALGTALADAGLRWANAAFVKPGFKLLPDYVDRLASAYGAQCFALSDRADADAWVKTQTDGLVEGLPASGMAEEVRLALLNAVAMDAEWASPFLPDDTWEDDFHAPDGDVRVPFMHQQAFAQYGEEMGMRFIQKGYRGGRLAMMLALPKTGKLSSALSKLKESGMKCFVFRRNPVIVRLSLPKLDCSFDASLADAIVAAGCSTPFSEKNAQFTGISQEPLVITEVAQRLRVQIDEGGTRAAAVTEVDMSKSAPRMQEEEPIELNLNEPFIFIIFDRETGAVCFAGTVVNPLG